jgi:hypothetical protein
VLLQTVRGGLGMTDETIFMTLDEMIVMTLVIAFVFYYLPRKGPKSFRENAEARRLKYFEKHAPKNTVWIRKELDTEKSISEEGVLTIIRSANNVGYELAIAIFILAIPVIWLIYPNILQPDSAYWQQMLLGIGGGVILIGLMRLIRVVSERFWMRRLVREALRKLK